MFEISQTTNNLASCDPGCRTCSISNPAVCTVCSDGYYMTTSNWCKPCTFASRCSSCSTTTPAVCLGCFAGHYLDTTTSTCIQCTFPCISCIDQNATKCSACPVGWALVIANNTCILTTNLQSTFGNIVKNCANSEIVANTTSGTDDF